MPKIKRTDMAFLDRELGMESGYVLDFSDKTMREFFEDEIGVDIDDDRYRENGTSKAKRLRHFLTISPGPLAGKALRELWNYRCHRMKEREKPNDNAHITIRFHDLVQKIEETRDGDEVSLAGAVERFAKDQTLEELVASIERDIAADKPQVALDRLHTYCMKKFAHLLKERGEDSPDAKETLNARAGRYFNPIRRAGVRPITGKIMRTTVDIFELFNGIRNNESLAHDNELVDEAEARYIFDSIVALLRFLKKTEGAHFGS